MAPHRLMVGAILFANEDILLMADRTMFVAPVGMRLPPYPAGTTLVIEYEIFEGHNVLASVRRSACRACRWRLIVVDGLLDIPSAPSRSFARAEHSES